VREWQVAFCRLQQTAVMKIDFQSVAGFSASLRFAAQREVLLGFGNRPRALHLRNFLC